MATKIGVVARAVVGRMTMTTGLGWSVAGVAIPVDLVSDDPKMAPLNDRWQGLAKKPVDPLMTMTKRMGRNGRAAGLERRGSSAQPLSKANLILSLNHCRRAGVIIS